MTAGSPAYAGAVAAPSGASPETGKFRAAAAVNEVLDWLRTRLKLWRCRRVGAGTRALGRVWIHGSGRTILGANVLLDGRLAPIELHAAAGAVIELGDNVTVHGGTSIEAVDSVTVGPDCVLAPFVKVIDNNFHCLRGDRHLRPPSRPVRVEDHVSIGERAIVLPGAHLQAGAEIATRTVISQCVPRGAFVQGNPPRLAVNRAGPP